MNILLLFLGFIMAFIIVIYYERKMKNVINEKYKNNLVKGGTIITDNLSFHGLVEDSDLVKTKNQRGIVNKIKNFISFLDNNEEFATEYIPVGDKIAISKRRSDYE